ncbi:MAG: pyridoxal phosphate-dependent aminotransferase [Clostridiaceae bacterium]|nr:pyridoxal phosphate-dependent aminotransferase [Clostridiaceae bacterium]
MNKTFTRSTKLNRVSYDIRGPILKEVRRLEAANIRVTRLNIGSPASFGLFAPENILDDVKNNITCAQAQAYCDSNGIEEARAAIVRYYNGKGVAHIGLDDVYIGNGVSELILLVMQALLNQGDEVLVPAPDYPLWTAAVNLSQGRAVHYQCDEQADWMPDIQDIENKITTKTKAIVLINPNNPTGAVYSKECLQRIVRLAEKHQLIIYSDEIYDKILYDGQKHISPASLTEDTLVVTLSGLSKSHRIAGFRVGWMVLSGNRGMAEGYIEGLQLLASMRLCSNVPFQYAIRSALEGYQCINDLAKPGGRLYEQRNIAYRMFNDIPGVSCTKPKGAFYLFPRLSKEKFGIKDDQQFALDLLLAKQILIVQGTGFNWFEPDHFRIVALMEKEGLAQAITDIGDFLSTYHQ